MKGFIGILIWIYGIISQIMTLVFFISYCRTDSFFEVLFIDLWLSELKGFFWIFFVVREIIRTFVQEFANITITI